VSPTIKDFLGFVVNPPPGDPATTAMSDQVPKSVVTTAAAGSGTIPAADGVGGYTWTTPAAALPPSGPAGGNLSGTYPNPLVSIATVTSLPVGPVDGQETYYLADATNGVVWHLRYRAASASTHKWEFVGGASLLAGPSGSMSTSGTASTPLTAGPLITLPLTGDYNVTSDVFAQSAGAGTPAMYGGPMRNGTAFGNSRIVNVSGQWGGGECFKQQRANGWAAGDVIGIACLSNQATTVNWSDGTLAISPIRVG
jgi:hypothetical protein